MIPTFGPCKGHHCDFCRICLIGRCCEEDGTRTPSPRLLTTAASRHPSRNPEYPLANDHEAGSPKAEPFGTVLKSPCGIENGQVVLPLLPWLTAPVDPLQWLQGFQSGASGEGSAQADYLRYLPLYSFLSGWRPSASKHRGRHPVLYCSLPFGLSLCNRHTGPVPAERLALRAQSRSLFRTLHPDVTAPRTLKCVSAYSGHANTPFQTVYPYSRPKVLTKSSRSAILYVSGRLTRWSIAAMLTEMITALGPNDPDDGDEGRQRRGLAISALTRIEKNRIGYKVPSQSGNGAYVVSLEDVPFVRALTLRPRSSRASISTPLNIPSSVRLVTTVLPR